VKQLHFLLLRYQQNNCLHIVVKRLNQKKLDVHAAKKRRFKQVTG